MIRKGKIEDLEVIIEFERDYMRTFEEDDLERWEESIPRNLLFLENHLDQMIVIEEDVIRGYGYWSIHNNLPCVFSIYVHKDYRYKGYGRMILEAIEKQVKSTSSMITLSTRTINPAQHLFDSMGYIRLGEKDGWISFKKDI